MNDRIDSQVLLLEPRNCYYGMTPLPDETTFSFVARAALLTGATDLRRVAVDLFESDGSFSHPRARLHGGFRQLTEHLGGFEGIDASSLLDSLSFLPLFRPFLDEGLYRWAQKLSCRSGATGLGKVLRIKHVGALRRTAAVCPECVKFDKTRYHNAYYHRVHQVSAVTICPTHGSTLLTHCPVCNLRLPNIPDEVCRGCGCILTLGYPTNDPTFEAHLRLAKFAEACIAGSMPDLDWRTRLAVLQTRAKQRIGNRSGIVGDNLATFLNRMFGREYLKSLGLATDGDKTIGWPSLAINGQAWIADIGPQLLLISALFDSVADYCSVCETQPRSPGFPHTVQPQRSEIPWKKVIFMDLLRIGDIAMVAERHRISTHAAQCWLAAYPGLSERLEARLRRSRKLR